MKLSCLSGKVPEKQKAKGERGKAEWERRNGKGRRPDYGSDCVE